MVAILEYGMGNVLSVQKALTRIGLESIITSDEQELNKCSHIILPGVGSFNRAMTNLHDRGLVAVIRKQVKESGKPFLGICLGMQLLATKGLEDGSCEGLDLISGTVRPIPSEGLPVPHIGWNEIAVNNDQYFSTVKDHNFYFVHSYFFDADNKEDVAATVKYGSDLTAAVQKDNIFGTQFHPEKSQEEGIEVLKSFFKVNA